MTSCSILLKESYLNILLHRVINEILRAPLERHPLDRHPGLVSQQPLLIAWFYYTSEATPLDIASGTI